MGHGNDLGRLEGREQTSAPGRRGKGGTTKRATSAALLGAGRWPSDPGLTRRCRLHPPRLRLLATRSTPLGA
ncbi:hypothetical protein GTW38_35320 [Streptomyces sp. SID7804]|uniref:Uncharacterized protein n=1 Tax=Streptomyces calvus TaxID=67282 RepID=A0A514JY54_9ACTN|nr:hypothetical protein [Streptomyces sp. SID7804]QDI72336.1 hypothetical protein CD934_29325 [Streptomyces calvus]